MAGNRKDRSTTLLALSMLALLLFVLSCATGVTPEGSYSGPGDEQQAAPPEGGPAKGAPSSIGDDMPSGQGNEAPPPADQSPPADNAAPPDDEEEPAAVEVEQQEQRTITNFAGSWHSAETCDERDAPYRWQITISQAQSSDMVSGTLAFHACPGGGRATYSLEGRATTEDYVVLTGILTGGRGSLHQTVPGSQSFRITRGEAPFPNLVP